MAIVPMLGQVTSPLLGGWISRIGVKAKPTDLKDPNR